MLQESKILRIPGPSPIPPSVQRAMSQPMIGHRGNEASVLMEELSQKIKPVFGTEQDVIMITGSGTSGLEAAVVNIASKGDEVLVVVTGAFGDRFAKICETYEIIVHRMEVTWGEAVNLDRVKEFMEENPQIKAVFTTYCETSTGVLNPISKISEVVRNVSNALVVVDGVSCVGGVDTRMDEWGVDLVVSGSQKALMLPAGLTFLAVSERAWDVISANEQPRFYLDLQKYKDNLSKHSTPYTPALSLLFGLNQALNLLEKEGLQTVYHRHRLMMNMVRGAMTALNIPLLASDQDASPTVTAVKPTDFDGEELRKYLKEEFNLDLAGGQQHLKGQIVRIGHMGYCTPADVLQVVSLIEIGLQKIGRKTTLGQGVAAAQEIYMKTGDFKS